MTHELVVQRREDHGIYEDLNSHLLTLTQLAEESTALIVCPFINIVQVILFSYKPEPQKTTINTRHLLAIRIIKRAITTTKLISVVTY